MSKTDWKLCHASEREVSFGIQVRESISWFFGGMSPPFLLVLTVLVSQSHLPLCRLQAMCT